MGVSWHRPCPLAFTSFGGLHGQYYCGGENWIGDTGVIIYVDALMEYSWAQYYHYILVHKNALWLVGLMPHSRNSI